MTDLADALTRGQRDGLWCYCDSFDTSLAHQAETVAIALRAGAVGLLPCVEANDGRRPSMDTLRAFKAACDAADLSCLPFTFPGIVGDLTASRVWFTTVCEGLGVNGQLDAEPAHIGHGTRHWSPALLDPWLDLPFLTSITTTRAEAPHLGPHDRDAWAQLEAQTSLDSLDRAMEIFGRYTEADRITLVTGLFDGKDKEGQRDPRTLSEVRADLHRATPQAIKSGKLAAWSAHSMSAAEADAYREWAVATWRAP